MLGDEIKGKKPSQLGNLKYFSIVSSLVGIFLSSVSLIKIYDELTSGGVAGVLLFIIQSYDEITDPFFRAISPLFLAIVNLARAWTGWDIILYPHWKDVFTLLVLYVSAHASHAFSGNLPAPRIAFAFRMLWGLFCAVGASVASGAVSLAAPEQSTITFAFCIIGIVAYRLGFAAQFAFDRWNYSGEHFWSEFGRKASGALVLSGIGAAIIAVGIWSEDLPVFETLASPAFAILIALLLALAAFHVWLGLSTTFRESQPRATGFWSLLSGKGNTIIGVRIFLTVVVTILAVAGLS